VSPLRARPSVVDSGGNALHSLAAAVVQSSRPLGAQHLVLPVPLAPTRPLVARVDLPSHFRTELVPEPLAPPCDLEMAIFNSQPGKRFGHKLLFESADWQSTRATEWPSAPMAPARPRCCAPSWLETLDYGSCQGMKSISAAIYTGRPRSVETRLRRVHEGFQ